nr:sigma-70 family RNA polymerase sigma factor [Membranihabitans maritimus]
MTAYLKGDNSAFESFYKKTYNDFFTYGLHFEHDKSTVKDLIQNFYLRIYNNPERFIPSGLLKPYLIRCFRNYILRQKADENKKKEHDKIYPSNADVSSPEEIICLNEDLHNQKEMGKSLLNLLSPREREIIFLRYYKNLSAKEVAKVLDINYQVVRNLTSRGINKIRERFSSREELIIQLQTFSQNLILFIFFWFI